MKLIVGFNNRREAVAQLHKGRVLGRRFAATSTNNPTWICWLPPTTARKRLGESSDNRTMHPAKLDAIFRRPSLEKCG